MVVPLNKTLSLTDECGKPKTKTSVAYTKGTDKFAWDESTQSWILSSVFIGYITTQLLGGRLAEHFGGKLVLGVPMLLAGLLSLLTPVAAKKLGSTAVMVLRVLIGMAEGVTFPAMHVILSNWAPPLERSRMVTMVYAGSPMGTILTLAQGGVMMRAWGWESIFYFYGGLTVIWFVAWFFLVSDSPENHPYISKEEKLFILATLSKEKKTILTMPWRQILTSVPFWALLVTHMGHNLGYWMLLTQLPTYMNNILHFEIQEVSKARQNIPEAQGGSALCLIGAAYVGCSRTMSVVLFCIAGICQGCIYSGYVANHLDLAPQFAGTLLGLTNTAASVTSWTAPLLAGSITKDNQTISAWRTVFWICAAVMLFDAIEYLVFGSGEEQTWNNPEATDTAPAAFENSARTKDSNQNYT
ncbi:unnamed protein product [Notodromas monacha]|uniref:Major facilitator superfamily (MFS) profile domain-containing protein n=1 Tax=Notodromas monacha TaxID=399045 RepID=A0A7R9BZQ3_9CRUS|nr:unnamed protein product [Notodromas monacha]CAG0923314.1 unnamed protein product [Notodromas monacha]